MNGVLYRRDSWDVSFGLVSSSYPVQSFSWYDFFCHVQQRYKVPLSYKLVSYPQKYTNLVNLHQFSSPNGAPPYSTVQQNQIYNTY